MNKTQQIIASITAVIIVGIFAFVLLKKFDNDAKINAQTEIEKTRIEQETKLERTKEHGNWIPWSKDE